MAKLSGDPLNRLSCTVGLPSSSEPLHPLVNDPNKDFPSSRTSTCSTTPLAASSSNPLDQISSPSIPFSTTRSTNAASSNAPLPSISPSISTSSSSLSFSNIALDRPLSDAAWANLWAPLELAPPPTNRSPVSITRVNDYDLFHSEASTCSRTRFACNANPDTSSQALRKPVSFSSSQISTVPSQSPSSHLFPEAELYKTRVQPELRAHPYTEFPSAPQSIEIITQTVTQTITQTVTATATSMVTTATVVVTASPTVTKVITPDAPSFLHVASNVTAANLVNRIVGNATIAITPLQTAAAKLAALSVHLDNHAPMAKTFLAGAVLGMSGLATARWLRQKYFLALQALPVSTGENSSAWRRLMRMYKYWFRMELEKSTKLRAMIAQQAVQLRDQPILNVYSAQVVVDDSMAEDTAPYDSRPSTPPTQPRVVNLSLSHSPSQQFFPDDATAITVRPIIPSALKSLSSPRTSRPQTARTGIQANGEEVLTDDIRDGNEVEEQIIREMERLHAKQSSKTQTSIKRSLDEAENDASESRSASLVADHPVATIEEYEDEELFSSAATSRQGSVRLDLNNASVFQSTRISPRPTKRPRKDGTLSTAKDATQATRITRSSPLKQRRSAAAAPP